ncbi:tetratricopeptide repeat protein 23 isoform X2 [Stegastes partitus]|uniref:Tetratricopeptide repeat protein 23-like n=1 Tax=Stegastes partitus TaxID=144197 RepID=A0A3B5BI45_9TELE|nr:PREDICTED: tetratricopeptide repeat protein 23-like isoform X2 [Stegastes partitus]
MDEDQAMTKTRPNSSESPTESPESLGSAHRAVDASPDCGSDVQSPSRTRCARKEFIMMPPEEKLKHFDSRAQASENNQEFDACIQDLVRCVALTRLVYGEGHLKVAQAHARLAKAYFHFKGWALQAQEHSSLARELLPFCSSVTSCRPEKSEVLTCLLSINLTQGGASLLTDNLEEAESSFLEAEHILEQLHQHTVISQEEKIKTQLEISTGLCRVYKRQSRPEAALSQCEKSLQLLKDCCKPEETCSVYKDMAAIEQDRGHLDRAIELLSKAHSIAMSHSPEELEGAQISHSLALILSAAAEPHHNDAAGHYFEQSLSTYKNCVGPQDPAFLAVQDDFCRFLLMNGEQEKCVGIQRASLDSKRSAFGELSAEVADTLQLIGSVEMTEGKMNQAHRTMTKCLKIQSLLCGPQHKKTRAMQKAVDMLARTPEVAERLQRQGRRKTIPHTFPLVPSSGNNEHSMSDS